MTINGESVSYMAVCVLRFAPASIPVDTGTSTDCGFPSGGVGRGVWVLTAVLRVFTVSPAGPRGRSHLTGQRQR